MVYLTLMNDICQIIPYMDGLGIDVDQSCKSGSVGCMGRPSEVAQNSGLPMINSRLQLKILTYDYYRGALWTHRNHRILIETLRIDLHTNAKLAHIHKKYICTPYRQYRAFNDQNGLCLAVELSIQSNSNRVQARSIEIETVLRNSLGPTLQSTDSEVFNSLSCSSRSAQLVISGDLSFQRSAGHRTAKRIHCHQF